MESVNKYYSGHEDNYDENDSERRWVDEDLINGSLEVALGVLVRDGYSLEAVKEVFGELIKKYHPDFDINKIKPETYN